jgi:hypothetical protein
MLTLTRAHTSLLLLTGALATGAGCSRGPGTPVAPGAEADGAADDGAIPDAPSPQSAADAAGPLDAAASDGSAGSRCDDLSACGPSCAPCPTVVHGRGVCNGTSCATVCDLGYHLCGDACLGDRDVAHCGARCQPCPVPEGGTASCDGLFCGASCPSGKLCGKKCIASSACCTAGAEGCPDYCATCTAGKCTGPPAPFRSEALASDASVLTGAVSYFNEGRPVPPGTYTIRYLDGCAKWGMGSDYGWTVNGVHGSRCCDWWLVGDTSSDRLDPLPAGVGAELYNQGAFTDFEACVSANKVVAPPSTYQHHGGRLGIWMRDVTYADNVVGSGGRNPRWELSGQTACE